MGLPQMTAQLCVEIHSKIDHSDSDPAEKELLVRLFSELHPDTVADWVAELSEWDIKGETMVAKCGTVKNMVSHLGNGLSAPFVEHWSDNRLISWTGNPFDHDIVDGAIKSGKKLKVKRGERPTR